MRSCLAEMPVIMYDVEIARFVRVNNVLFGKGGFCKDF